MVIAAAACGSLSTGTKPASVVNPALAAAFTTVPVGFASTQNSYDTSAAPIAGTWFPGAPDGGMGRHEGQALGAGLGPMIGGGLRGDFLGGLGLGRLFGRGRFGDPDLDGDNCTFVVATGRLTCAPVTHDGLTIVASVVFTTTSGTVQSAFDSLTNTVNGIIVPVSDTGRTYPTAGKIIRAMSVTLTYTGKTPQTSTRREVITYNGTNTATLVITQNGTTKTCTLPLPFGRPTCP